MFPNTFLLEPVIFVRGSDFLILIHIFPIFLISIKNIIVIVFLGFSH